MKICKSTFEHVKQLFQTIILYRYLGHGLVTTSKQRVKNPLLVGRVHPYSFGIFLDVKYKSPFLSRTRHFVPNSVLLDKKVRVLKNMENRSISIIRPAQETYYSTV